MNKTNCVGFKKISHGNMLKYRQANEASLYVFWRNAYKFYRDAEKEKKSGNK